jgi:hypothetical protein
MLAQDKFANGNLSFASEIEARFLPRISAELWAGLNQAWFGTRHLENSGYKNLLPGHLTGADNAL